jgi:hypothetical protein
LTSESAIREAATNNEVTISKTGIILNCPVVFGPGSGKLPNTQVFGKNQRNVAFPLVHCYFDGAAV